MGILGGGAMAVDMAFLAADEDFYELWGSGDPGQPYQVGPLPSGWTGQRSGPWMYWAPAGVVLPGSGWKVHVSTSLPNAQAVLSVVATACAELAVPFKHLAGREMFLQAHDKHADRMQSGKFCAIYPADPESARQVMERLAGELSGLAGPYVLTDRRFGTSECVSYRYGAFLHQSRPAADGTRILTLPGPDGIPIDDDRGPVFRLPPGIVDPFAAPAGPPSSASITLGGYHFEKVLRHANSGGAYRFRDEQGVPVFIKEARAHNGYTVDGSDAQSRLAAEYLILRALHARAPGLGPRPVELFRKWEHSYLVTELVPGVSLYGWMVAHNPAIRIGEGAAAFADYHRRCLAVLDQLDTQLRLLHDLGYLFVDLSPGNVLVDEDDTVRLIDFESAQRLDDLRVVIGTPGYLPVDAAALIREEPREVDRRGLAALALLLLFPVHDVVDRNPAALEHLHADLSEQSPVPPRLWSWATSGRLRHTAHPDAAGPLPGPGAVRRDVRGPGEVGWEAPGPEEVRRDVRGAVRRLAEQTADLLVGMAEPSRADRIYPTNPLGLRTDTRCLAAGTAGVLHALHRAGRPIDPAMLRRLRDDSLASVEGTPPGLLHGSAGIAGVLAELGEPEAAESLLVAASAHPLNETSVTLGGGAAGTALGLLTRYADTGESRWLELAEKLLAGVTDADLAGRVGPDNASGLVAGRTGVALALFYLARFTDNPEALRQGQRLLREELVLARQIRRDALGFVMSGKDNRVVPYLGAGSAGYVAVLARYLAHCPDLELGLRTDTGVELDATAILDRCLRACRIRFTVFPGLFSGLAGLTFTLAETGRVLERPELVEAAWTSARGLFRYAVPRSGGVGWLGEPGHRFSADLWSGSAGVLLVLHQLIDPAPDPLFTLDERQTTRAPRDLERR